MVFIDDDERYPVFSFQIIEPLKVEALNLWKQEYLLEISQETLDRWERISSDYNKMQDEMRKLSEEAYEQKCDRKVGNN